MDPCSTEFLAILINRVDAIERHTFYYLAVCGGFLVFAATAEISVAQRRQLILIPGTFCVFTVMHYFHFRYLRKQRKLLWDLTTGNSASDTPSICNKIFENYEGLPFWQFWAQQCLLSIVVLGLLIGVIIARNSRSHEARADS